MYLPPSLSPFLPPFLPSPHSPSVPPSSIFLFFILPMNISRVPIQSCLKRIRIIYVQFAAWNSTQRWTLVEYLLQRLTDPHLIKIYNLLAPLMPPDLPPPQDFTRVLPRALSLRIFSYLDPKSLSRAAQVHVGCSQQSGQPVLAV